MSDLFEPVLHSVEYVPIAPGWDSSGVHPLKPTEWERVMHRIPSFVRDILDVAPQVVVLAGGFVRDAVADDAYKDIDLFFWNGDGRALERAQVAVDKLMAPTGPYANFSSSGTERSITISGDQSQGLPSLQFVYANSFAGPMELIRGFDFTICQAAVWRWQGAWESACTKEFHPDVKARQLRLVEGIERTTLRRVVRMYVKGYMPVDASSESEVEEFRGLFERIDELESKVEELQGKIDSEDRFMASLQARVAVLPADGT